MNGTALQGRYVCNEGHKDILHPVLVQAGSSPEGVAFAGRHAEVIFAPPAPPHILKGMVEKWRSAVSDSGRDPDKVRILSPIGGVVSNSREEAHARRAEIMERIPYELGLRNVSNMAGFDLNDYPPETKVTDILDKITGMRGPFEVAAKQNETLRDVAARQQNMVADTRFVGTPQDVADAMEADLEATGADGYQLSAPYYAPDYFKDIVDLLIPELRKRGRVREEYTNATLRESIQQT